MKSFLYYFPSGIRVSLSFRPLVLHTSSSPENWRNAQEISRDKCEICDIDVIAGPFGFERRTPYNSQVRAALCCLPRHSYHISFVSGFLFPLCSPSAKTRRKILASGESPASDNIISSVMTPYANFTSALRYQLGIRDNTKPRYGERESNTPEFISSTSSCRLRHSCLDARPPVNPEPTVPCTRTPLEALCQHLHRTDHGPVHPGLQAD